MKRNFLKLPKLFPSRVPQLFFGPSAVPRELSQREILADRLFLSIQILSYVLFAIGGFAGYYLFQIYGLLIFGVLGYLIGIWMRRSAGIRGEKLTTGFFARMRERALGSRPGLLEAILEKISQDECSQAQCRAVTQAHERAVKQLKLAKSPEEQNKILADLDKRIKQILYK